MKHIIRVPLLIFAPVALVAAWAMADEQTAVDYPKPIGSPCGTHFKVDGSDSQGVIRGGDSHRCVMRFATAYASPPACAGAMARMNDQTVNNPVWIGESYRLPTTETEVMVVGRRGIPQSDWFRSKDEVVLFMCVQE